MDCPNIMQIVAKIKKQKEFNKLAFFISTANAALVIPKIMVFVNSLDERTILAIYLQNLFFKYI